MEQQRAETGDPRTQSSFNIYYIYIYTVLNFVIVVLPK